MILLGCSVIAIMQENTLVLTTISLQFTLFSKKKKKKQRGHKLIIRVKEYECSLCDTFNFFIATFSPFRLLFSPHYSQKLQPKNLHFAVFTTSPSPLRWLRDRVSCFTYLSPETVVHIFLSLILLYSYFISRSSR